MWPTTDNKIPQADLLNNSQPQATPAETFPAPTRAAQSSTMNQHSVIGKSIIIKGEIAATDPLYIYGCIEGLITAPAHRVTVGKEGQVNADITAREVVIMGEVCGNLNSGERVEIRGDGSLTGNLATHRICIEEGATLRGKIDVHKPAEKPKVEKRKQPVPAFEAEPAVDLDHDQQTWSNLAISEIA